MTSIEVQQKSRLSFPLLVALAVGLLFMRGAQRLSNPALFAEDGAVFLAGAKNDGLWAFTEQYAGYLHLLPRIIAAAFSSFPIVMTPVLYAGAALAVHAALLTPALSARLEWLIPGKMRRATLFVLLCLLPPLPEALANIANLIFLGGITLLLLMLSDDPRSSAGRIFELIAVVALGLSGPLSVIFAPWFAWRWRRTKTVHSVVVFVAVASTAVIQGSIFVLSDRQTSGGDIVYLPQVWVERIGVAWIAGHVDLLHSPMRLGLTVLATAWSLVVVAVTVMVLKRTAVALWLLHFALLAAPVLAYGYMPPPSADQRHFVVPTAIIVVMLVAVLGADKLKIGALVLLILGIGGMLYDFAAAPYSYRPSLTNFQECVDRGESTCKQSIYDDSGHWQVELHH
ncbi:hypothetical protein [Mycobacterium asiaticum]|uniref:hypothetical protein n=1 Tax=Mycobacterium asiaticum TaxID=1790 RepID=UPI000A9625AA|nr:hypothetical protein [Mycobacterium asiaticum]